MVDASAGDQVYRVWKGGFGKEGYRCFITVAHQPFDGVGGGGAPSSNARPVLRPGSEVHENNIIKTKPFYIQNI